MEQLRRRHLPRLGGSALAIRSLFPPLAICVGVLGGAWGLWILAAILYMAWIVPLDPGSAGASAVDDSESSDGDRHDESVDRASFEPILHHHGLWMLLGGLVVGLLEPMVRIDIELLGGAFAFVAAAFLGAAFCRNPLFGSILAFFWLHCGWRPELVATFLVFGTARWMLGSSWLMPRTRASAWTAIRAGGGAVALIWISTFLPAQGRAHFHDLAETPLDWLFVLQVATLGGLALVLLMRLFRSGFRALLRPIVDPAAEMTRYSVES